MDLPEPDIPTGMLLLAAAVVAPVVIILMFGPWH